MAAWCQQSAIFEQAGLVETVRILSGRTMYARIGDAIAYLSIVITILALLFTRRVRLRGTRPTQVGRVPRGGPG